MSKILITGSAGYLGRVLYPMLQEKYEVVGMDNFLYGQGNVGALHGDITSLKDMYNFTKGIDVVVALAGIVGDPACGLDEEMTRIINFESTKLLADVCEANKVKKLIFASSCSVYGASKEARTVRCKTNPLSLYAQTKLDSENIILERCKICQPIILRFGTLFGYSPRMRFDLVANIMTAMAVKEGKVVVNGGDQWRPMVHVQDVAKRIRNIILFNQEPKKENVVGKNYKIREIANVISEITGAKIIENNENRDERDYVALYYLEDFEPLTLEDGVKEIIEHFKAGEFENYKDNKYYNVRILEQLK